MEFTDLVTKKKIILESRGLRDGDLGVLAEVLQKSKVLEGLHLWNNQITLTDTKLTDALARNRTLWVLNLGGNKIGAEGAKRLAEALEVNQTLQEIWLYDNQIGDEGAKSFAGALAINKTLQVMGLQCNNIGDEGAQSLAASFETNQSLRDLSLGENKIGDKEGKELLNALKCNNVIRKIDLHFNHHIRNSVKGDIEEILCAPKSMRNMKKIYDAIIAKKDEKMAADCKEIIKPKAEIAKRDGKIALLEAELKSPATLVKKILAGKDEKIAALQSELKNSTKPIIDTVDLTSGEAERASKRPRTGGTQKSGIAILHEQNQKIVRVKQEKNVAETKLKTAQAEKEAVEADLDEARDDLGDANDLVQQQYLAQDIWQRRFDELAALAGAGQVDAAAISDIRKRSLASGS